MSLQRTRRLAKCAASLVRNKSGRSAPHVWKPRLRDCANPALNLQAISALPSHAARRAPGVMKDPSIRDQSRSGIIATQPGNGETFSQWSRAG